MAQEITHRPFNPHSDSLAVTNLKLSPEDLVEMVGKGYHSVPTYIATSVSLSHDTYVIEAVNKGIVGVFGIRYLSPLEAVPWLLCGSVGIQDYSYRFLKGSKEIVDNWSLNYNLEQEVWEGHKAALKWLKWLGFEDLCEDRTLDNSIIYRTLRRPIDV